VAGNLKNNQTFQDMNQPLVSVVLVVCNVDRFLAESIESILGQTFQDLEFIIVDFGSTDNSRAIVASYAANEARILSYDIAHCGLAEARNAACFRAQGQYIAIMDADDVSTPERLRWQVEFMERHPEVSVLGGAVEWIDTSGRPLIIRDNPVGNREIQTALLECCPLWQPTVMMRRDAFVAVGGYRPAFAPAEDYDLWLRMAGHCEIANLRQVVLKYRIHPHQVSMRKQTQQTLGILAAQVSASARRSGQADPLSTAKEITPELLSRLGIGERKLQSQLTSNRRQWIRHMCMAGELSVALEAALALLQSNLEHVERWQVADIQLTVSSLYWRQKRYAKSLLSACRALITRPVVAGRPLKPLLQRLRWI